VRGGGGAENIKGIVNKILLSNKIYCDTI